MQQLYNNNESDPILKILLLAWKTKSDSFLQCFEEGQIIRYCRHDNLCDVVDNVIYFEESQARAYSIPSRRKAISSRPSDEEAPEGYFYYDWTVSKVTTLELPNGEQVPFADGRIVFGWGDVYINDLLHQFVPDCESAEGMFLYRVHQGQVILRNNGNVQSINNIIGTDVLSLFDKPEGYHPFVEEGKVWKRTSCLLILNSAISLGAIR